MAESARNIRQNALKTAKSSRKDNSPVGKRIDRNITEGVEARSRGCIYFY